MTIDLDAIDARLNEIAQQIVATIEGATFAQKSVLLLTNRAMELRHVAMQVAESSPAASAVILRALIDLAILIRWIELRPGLYNRLWAAEGNRYFLATREDLMRSMVARGQPIGPDPDDLADTKRIVCRARALAIGRGVVRPDSRSPSLLPSIRARARAIDDDIEKDIPEEQRKMPYLELYNLGVGHYSAWTHSGAHSMMNSTGPEVDRRIAASVVAGLLASASRQRGLAFGEELDMIRHILVHVQENAND